MCGIVGIYLKTKKFEKSLGKMLSGMLNNMESRGPDSAGFAIYKNEEKEIFKVAISELVGKLSGQSEIEYLILDGIITQRLLDAAKKAEIKYVIGHRVAKLTNDDGITLKTFTELGIA